MSDHSRGSGVVPAPSGVVIGPDAGFIGVACVAVATAELLGAYWLRDPLLGVPTGLWLIAAGYGLMRIARNHAKPVPGAQSVIADTAETLEVVETVEASPAHQSAGEDGSGQLQFAFSGSTSSAAAPRLTLTSAEPRSTPDHLWNAGGLLERSGYSLSGLEEQPPAPPGAGGRLVLGALGGFARAASAASARSSSRPGWTKWLSERHDAGGWPTRPLRIGLDLASDLAAMLIRAGGGLGLEWVPVPAGGNDQAQCREHAVDGIVRMDAVGDIHLRTAEHPAREAAWYDWSKAMPLSYSAVFPMRVDPCMVTLSRGWGFDHRDARLIARLIQTAAILSRSRTRLGLSDRLRGRRPFDLAGETGPEGTLRSHAMLVGAMSRLAESVCTERDADPVPLKSAARVLGAWASTTDAAIDPELRKEAVEASLRVLEGEPEAILRAVATRFATYDDNTAFAGVLEAVRAIRAAEHGPILDPVAFLEAEIELGLPGPMTFGRVAAGLCLVGATTEDAKLDYVCDDLIEEMRYSGWLIGRDADRRVLIEVARAVQQARRRGPAREAA